jgi:hypothetical protein
MSSVRTRSASRKAAYKKKKQAWEEAPPSDDSADSDYIIPRRPKTDEYGISATEGESSSSEEKPRSKRPSKKKTAGRKRPKLFPRREKSKDDGEDYGGGGSDGDPGGGSGKNDGERKDDAADVVAPQYNPACANRAWEKIYKVHNVHGPDDLISDQARDFANLIDDPTEILNTQENRAKMEVLMSNVPVSLIIPKIRSWFLFDPVPSGAVLKNKEGTLDVGPTGYISGLLEWGQYNRERLRDFLYALANSLEAELDDAAKLTAESNCTDLVDLPIRMQRFRETHPIAPDLERYLCAPPMSSTKNLFLFMVPAYSAVQLRNIVDPDMPMSRVKAIQKAWRQKEITDTNVEAVLHFAYQSALLILALQEPGMKRRATKIRTFLSKHTDNPLARFLGGTDGLYYLNILVPVESYEDRDDRRANRRQKTPDIAWRDKTALRSIAEARPSLFDFLFEDDFDFAQAPSAIYKLMERNNIDIYNFAGAVGRQLGLQPVPQKAPKMSGAHVDLSDDGYLGCLCAWGNRNRPAFLNVLQNVWKPSAEQRIERIIQSNFMVQKNVCNVADKTRQPDFTKYGVHAPFCAEDNIFLWRIPKYSSADVLTDENGGIGISASRRRGMQLGWNRFFNSALNILFLKHFYDKFLDLANSIASERKMLKHFKKLREIRSKCVLASSLYKLAKEIAKEEAEKTEKNA